MAKKGPYVSGWDDLYEAVVWGSTDEIEQTLMEGYSDIDEPCPSGYTPLMTAAQHGAWEAVACLLDNGADPMFRGIHGTTALHYAVERRLIYKKYHIPVDEYREKYPHPADEHHTIDAMEQQDQRSLAERGLSC